MNFFATWCLPCKLETPMLVNQYPRYAGKIQFLSIDVEEQTTTVALFVQKYRIPWRVGVDSGASLTRFGVRSLPESFFIDKRGIVRAIYRGYMQPGDFMQNVGLVMH